MRPIRRMVMGVSYGLMGLVESTARRTRSNQRSCHLIINYLTLLLQNMEMENFDSMYRVKFKDTFEMTNTYIVKSCK